MRVRLTIAVAFLTVAAGVAAVGTPAAAAPPDDPGEAADHWTAERRARAIPRDLVLDGRGLAYLRLPGGALQPYGHDAMPTDSRPPVQVDDGTGARAATPRAKPGGTDAGPASITNLDPADGVTVGPTHTFSALVDDPDGIKSVTFNITAPDSGTYSFSAASGDGATFTVGIQFNVGGAGWSWTVSVKDGARRGGNVYESEPEAFDVDLGGGEATDPGDQEDPDGIVANAPWTGGGNVQTAAGRIYFEMPNRGGKKWVGYVCSGTAVTDTADDRSVVLTAAHCVYDDVNKVFARNVLFIPDQANTRGTATDLDCGNDPLGCWTPSFGVVDTAWATKTFPANIPWDYAFYVIDDVGSHTGPPTRGALESEVAPMDVAFDPPALGSRTHALGYSYSEDPELMYCAEALGTEDSYGDHWLPTCGLSGGSSGGPWTQASGDLGTGPLVSVNSWGYSDQPGMGGPPLHGNSADCLYALANGTVLDGFDGVADGEAGVVGLETASGSCSPGG